MHEVRKTSSTENINNLHMKKIILVLTTIIIAGTSCNKTNIMSPNEDTQTKEQVVLAKDKPKHTPKVPVYNRRPDWVEDGNKVKCPEAGTQCSVSKATAGYVNESQQVQIDLVNSLVAHNKGNDYFNTEDWYMLFEEIESMEGMLEQINNNTVHLYKLSTADAYQTFCLSTAETPEDANSSNTIYIWKF